MKADAVFYNCTVYPVIPEGKTYEALAVKGQRILSVGSYDYIKGFIGDETSLYDLKGQILLPGFIDTHVHLLDTGLNETRLNFESIESIGDLIEAIRKQVSETPAGGWIIGGSFDESFIIEKRLPTLKELDFAAPDNPLYINHRSYHCSLVNSLALKLLEFDKDLQGLECDFSGNNVGGLLIKDANIFAKEKVAGFVTDLDLEKAFRAVSKLAASVGLTTIHCVEGGDYWSDAYPDYILKAKPKTFEPVLYFNTKDIEKIKQRGLPRMGGDILVDGSISNHSAAFIEGYSDLPDAKGTIFYSQPEIQELIRKAHLGNIQISFHAIGDRAIEEIITAFEEVLPAFPESDHRHRIEHFGIPLPEHISRAKRLGLALAVQPAFTYQKASTYITRLGEERFRRAYPLRDLVSTGVLIGGGSDSMVSPLDPIFGIHASVNAPNEEQRLTLEEAIKLYTIWAAALAFQEEEKGSLEPGKYADLVVLEKDIRKEEPSCIESVKVTGTVYHGKIVYGINW